MKEFVISQAKAETAVLVGLVTKEQDEAKTKEYLDELEFLADTAGAVTVKRFTQKVGGPSQTTYVGSGKLQEIKASGTTIVIVSHSLGQIEQICERSYWIDNGVIRMEGRPRDVHPHYLEYMSNKSSEANSRSAAQKTDEKNDDAEATQTNSETSAKEDTRSQNRWGSGEARMKSVTVLDSKGAERLSFSPEEQIKIHIEYHAKEKLPSAVIGLAIYKSDQTYYYGTNSLLDYSHTITLQEEGTIDLYLDSLPVANGSYTIDLALHRPDGFEYDFWKDICSISIVDPKNTPGLIHLPHRWEIN